MYCLIFQSILDWKYLITISTYVNLISNIVDSSFPWHCSLFVSSILLNIYFPYIVQCSFPLHSSMFISSILLKFISSILLNIYFLNIVEYWFPLHWSMFISSTLFNVYFLNIVEHFFLSIVEYLFLISEPGSSIICACLWGTTLWRPQSTNATRPSSFRQVSDTILLIYR